MTTVAQALRSRPFVLDCPLQINRYPQRPLIYNIAWKTAIYYVVASLIHYLERLFDFSREAGGDVAGNRRLLSEMIWPHVLAI